MDFLFRPEYIFARTALLATFLAGISFGIVGTFVVVRRIGYLAGAISHCAFGGIGIGLYLKYCIASGALAFLFPTTFADRFDPVHVALIVAIIAAVLIGLVRQFAKEREDSIIGVMWAVGMAIGFLLFYRTPYTANITSYLFGEISIVGMNDCLSLAVLGIVVVIFFAVFFKRFEAVCFDEEYAKLRGIPSTFYLQSLLILTAITVVLMVRVVGILLVIAMLTLPASCAGRLCKRLFPMMILSIVFSLVFSWTGILLSLKLDTSIGPTIILVAAFAYSGILFCEFIRSKLRITREQ